MRKLKKIIYYLRSLPILFFVKWNDDKLLLDLKRWKKVLNIKGNDRYILSYLLFRYKEFRNLFIYRNRLRKIFKCWIKIWYKPMESLYIEAKEIEGGLFIQHGFSTMISAEYIGKNCWINQQVTIGFKDNTKPPRIGDNVTITCGAKVLGNIKVGNNSVIGANSVVVKDVEDGTTMVGIPAHKLERRN